MFQRVTLSAGRTGISVLPRGATLVDGTVLDTPALIIDGADPDNPDDTFVIVVKSGNAGAIERFGNGVFNASSHIAMRMRVNEEGWVPGS